MLNFLIALRSDERGVSALEYAILAGLVIGALTLAIAGLDFTAIFENLNTKITAVAD